MYICMYVCPPYARTVYVLLTAIPGLDCMCVTRESAVRGITWEHTQVCVCTYMHILYVRMYVCSHVIHMLCAYAILRICTCCSIYVTWFVSIGRQYVFFVGFLMMLEQRHLRSWSSPPGGYHALLHNYTSASFL